MLRPSIAWNVAINQASRGDDQRKDGVGPIEPGSHNSYRLGVSVFQLALSGGE
jgi:hypothetical protein